MGPSNGDAISTHPSQHMADTICATINGATLRTTPQSHDGGDHTPYGHPYRNPHHGIMTNHVDFPHWPASCRPKSGSGPNNFIHLSLKAHNLHAWRKVKNYRHMSTWERHDDEESVISFRWLCHGCGVHHDSWYLSTSADSFFFLLFFFFRFFWNYCS